MLLIRVDGKVIVLRVVEVVPIIGSRVWVSTSGWKVSLGLSLCRVNLRNDITRWLGSLSLSSLSVALSYSLLCTSFSLSPSLTWLRWLGWGMEMGVEMIETIAMTEIETIEMTEIQMIEMIEMIEMGNEWDEYDEWDEWEGWDDWKWDDRDNWDD
jgi:hypothetical protein